MTYYTTRQIREILGLGPGIVRRLTEAGFVKPQRGLRREYRFSFRDLVALRAAKDLTRAGVPARRISRSLQKLRAQLPDDMPANGLRIVAVGDRVAVVRGREAWRADDGQYLLAFDLAAPQGHLVVLDRRRAGETSPDEWFEQGCALEDTDPEGAIARYRRALAAGGRHAGIYTNLGRLLHERGELREAETVYREGLRHCPQDALLHFNLGVLLDDQLRRREAATCYHAALQCDPRMADAHYNLALLYEAEGDARAALRHLSACRRLRSGKT